MPYKYIYLVKVIRVKFTNQLKKYTKQIAENNRGHADCVKDLVMLCNADVHCKV